MKILNLVMTLLMTRTQGPSENPGFLASLTTKSIRKVFMIFAGVLGSIVLFFGGFITVIMDLILTSRDAQGLALSQASIVGFGLIILSAAAAAWLFSRKVWALPSFEPHAQSMQAPQMSPVHDAIAELIRDFTEERKMARLRAEAELAAAMAAVSAAEADLTTTGPVVGSETYPTENRSAFN